MNPSSLPGPFVPRRGLAESLALTIAGSDPSGGAGLQADLKTFHQFGCYGASVVTLLTVQNTVGVSAVNVLDPDFVIAQLRAVTDDLQFRAAKTGALGTAAVVEAVANEVPRFQFPLVVDPVLISKHGHPLAGDDVVQALQRRLLPLAYLVTPNRYEAERLTGILPVDRSSAAGAVRALHDLGAQGVYLKGSENARGEQEDYFSVSSDADVLTLTFPRQQTTCLHGSGCVLSAALTACLARGLTAQEAVTYSTHFVQAAIASAPRIGKGMGPLEIRLDGM